MNLQNLTINTKLSHVKFGIGTITNIQTRENTLAIYYITFENPIRKTYDSSSNRLVNVYETRFREDFMNDDYFKLV